MKRKRKDESKSEAEEEPNPRPRKKSRLFESLFAPIDHKEIFSLALEQFQPSAQTKKVSDLSRKIILSNEENFVTQLRGIIKGEINPTLTCSEILSHKLIEVFTNDEHRNMVLLVIKKMMSGKDFSIDIFMERLMKKEGIREKVGNITRLFLELHKFDIYPIQQYISTCNLDQIYESLLFFNHDERMLKRYFGIVVPLHGRRFLEFLLSRKIFEENYLFVEQITSHLLSHYSSLTILEILIFNPSIYKYPFDPNIGHYYNYLPSTDFVFLNHHNHNQQQQQQFTNFEEINNRRKSLKRFCHQILSSPTFKLDEFFQEIIENMIVLRGVGSGGGNTEEKSTTSDDKAVVWPLLIYLLKNYDYQKKLHKRLMKLIKSTLSFTEIETEHHRIGVLMLFVVFKNSIHFSRRKRLTGVSSSSSHQTNNYFGPENISSFGDKMYKFLTYLYRESTKVDKKKKKKGETDHHHNHNHQVASFDSFKKFVSIMHQCIDQNERNTEMLSMYLNIFRKILNYNPYLNATPDSPKKKKKKKKKKNSNISLNNRKNQECVRNIMGCIKKKLQELGESTDGILFLQNQNQQQSSQTIIIQQPPPPPPQPPPQQQYNQMISDTFLEDHVQSSSNLSPAQIFQKVKKMESVYPRWYLCKFIPSIFNYVFFMRKKNNSQNEQKVFQMYRLLKQNRKIPQQIAFQFDHYYIYYYQHQQQQQRRRPPPLPPNYIFQRRQPNRKLHEENMNFLCFQLDKIYQIFVVNNNNSNNNETQNIHHICTQIDQKVKSFPVSSNNHPIITFQDRKILTKKIFNLTVSFITQRFVKLLRKENQNTNEYYSQSWWLSTHFIPLCFSQSSKLIDHDVLRKYLTLPFQKQNDNNNDNSEHFFFVFSFLYSYLLRMNQRRMNEIVDLVLKNHIYPISNRQFFVFLKLLLLMYQILGHNIRFFPYSIRERLIVMVNKYNFFYSNQQQQQKKKKKKKIIKLNQSFQEMKDNFPVSFTNFLVFQVLHFEDFKLFLSSSSEGNNNNNNHHVFDFFFRNQVKEYFSIPGNEMMKVYMNSILICQNMYNCVSSASNQQQQQQQEHQFLMNEKMKKIRNLILEQYFFRGHSNNNRITLKEIVGIVYENYIPRSSSSNSFVNFFFQELTYLAHFFGGQVIDVSNSVSVIQDFGYLFPYSVDMNNFFGKVLFMGSLNQHNNNRATLVLKKNPLFCISLFRYIWVSLEKEECGGDVEEEYLIFSRLRFIDRQVLQFITTFIKFLKSNHILHRNNNNNNSISYAEKDVKIREMMDLYIRNGKHPEFVAYNLSFLSTHIFCGESSPEIAQVMNYLIRKVYTFSQGGGAGAEEQEFVFLRSMFLIFTECMVSILLQVFHYSYSVTSKTTTSNDFSSSSFCEGNMDGQQRWIKRMLVFLLKKEPNVIIGIQDIFKNGCRFIKKMRNHNNDDDDVVPVGISVEQENINLMVSLIILELLTKHFELKWIEMKILKRDKNNNNNNNQQVRIGIFKKLYVCLKKRYSSSHTQTPSKIIGSHSANNNNNGNINNRVGEIPMRRLILEVYEGSRGFFMKSPIIKSFLNLN